MVWEEEAETAEGGAAAREKGVTHADNGADAPVAEDGDACNSTERNDDLMGAVMKG